MIPPAFPESRSDLMWTPPVHQIELGDRDKSLARLLTDRFGQTVRQTEKTSDMLTVEVEQSRIKDVLRFLKKESVPRFQRLDDFSAGHFHQRR